MKIYFAGPLFTEAERNWIRLMIERIRSFFSDKEDLFLDIVFPYDLITHEEILTLGNKARIEIFERCRKHLLDTDIMIAVLDGTQVDDGTAWEIGYFYNEIVNNKTVYHKKIIGIRTDFRFAGESMDACVNAMIEGACNKIVKNIDELLGILAFCCMDMIRLH